MANFKSTTLFSIADTVEGYILVYLDGGHLHLSCEGHQRCQMLDTSLARLPASDTSSVMQPLLQYICIHLLQTNWIRWTHDAAWANKQTGTSLCSIFCSFAFWWNYTLDTRCTFCKRTKTSKLCIFYSFACSCDQKYIFQDWLLCLPMLIL